MQVSGNRSYRNIITYWGKSMKKCWNLDIGKFTAIGWMTFIAFFWIDLSGNRWKEIDTIRCQSHCGLVIVPKEVVE
jgi:hypothetical protein